MKNTTHVHIVNHPRAIELIVPKTCDPSCFISKKNNA